jgi:hypothetical protein
MAKGSQGAENTGKGNSGLQEYAKVADIKTASKTLADAKDFSYGYGDTMNFHINDGRTKK